MKKLLTILPALLWFSLSFGQNVPDNIRTAPTPATGSNKNNKAQVDANLRVSLSFRIPSGPTESLNGAKDSIGYLFFNTTTNRLKVYRGSGVWDSYTTQADLGNYQPLLGYTAANDVNVIHNIAPNGTTEGKNINLTGQIVVRNSPTNTGLTFFGDANTALSFYKADGSTYYGGINRGAQYYPMATLNDLTIAARVDDLHTGKLYIGVTNSNTTKSRPAFIIKQDTTTAYGTFNFSAGHPLTALSADYKAARDSAINAALAAYQLSLGFTPENIANKVTTLTSPNNTTYPTSQAVANAIAAIPAGGVTSFNGRTGSVVPIAGEYASLTESLTNKNLTSNTNTFPTFNQNTTGNAATATTLQTARTINGVSFNGSTNISFTTDAVNEGTTNFYFTQPRVLSTSLTGYTLGSNVAISATDNLLAMAGKFQAQINATNTALSNYWLLAGNNNATGVNTFSPTITGAGTGNTANLAATQTANNQVFSTWTFSAPTITTAGFTGAVPYSINVLGSSLFGNTINGTGVTMSGTITANTQLSSPKVVSANGFLSFNTDGRMLMSSASTNFGQLIWGDVTTTSDGSKIQTVGTMAAISGKSAGISIKNNLRPSASNDVLVGLDIAPTNETGSTAILSHSPPVATGSATVSGTSTNLIFTGGTGNNTFRANITYTIGTNTVTVLDQQGGNGYTVGDVLTNVNNGVTVTFTVSTVGLTGIKSYALRTNGDINLNYTLATSANLTQVLVKDPTTLNVSKVDLSGMVRVVSLISTATTIPTLIATSDYNYQTTNASTRVVITLPVNCIAGARILITGVGAAGWELDQNAGDVIKTSGGTTTTGTAGKIQSSVFNNCIEIICNTSNATGGNTYTVQSFTGSPTFN